METLVANLLEWIAGKMGWSNFATYEMDREFYGMEWNKEELANTTPSELADILKQIIIDRFVSDQNMLEWLGEYEETLSDVQWQEIAGSILDDTLRG